MPFGGWFDRYWLEIYRPAIEAVRLQPYRADDVYRSGSIMSDIWQFTRKADVVLADVTGRNGNVLYELGLAHAAGKPTILISESINDVPFDLRGLRVLLYDRQAPNWGIQLGDALAEGLRQTIAEPLLSIPATFVEERLNPQQPDVSASETELVQLRQDVERLMRQVLPPTSRANFELPVLPSWGSMFPATPSARYGNIAFNGPPFEEEESESLLKHKQQPDDDEPTRGNSK